MRHAVGAAIVSLFAVVFIHGGWLLRLVNPAFSRYLGLGLPGGPNALLVVRGRSTGRIYRVPVAMLEFEGRRFVQAAFGEVGWVQNLRVAGEARITKGRRRGVVNAVELTPETAGAVMHDALGPFERSPLVRSVVGPTTRPPAGVLRSFGIRVDETLDEYVAVARRQPLFELLDREG